jgi:hypothetical protein
LAIKSIRREESRNDADKSIRIGLVVLVKFRLLLMEQNTLSRSCVPQFQLVEALHFIKFRVRSFAAEKAHNKKIHFLQGFRSLSCYFLSNYADTMVQVCSSLISISCLPSLESSKFLEIYSKATFIILLSHTKYKIPEI